MKKVELKEAIASLPICSKISSSDKIVVVSGDEAAQIEASKILFDGSIDLSLRDIYGNVLSGRSTANCYVVGKPGTYKFPIVYGNAIHNGVDNTDSYTSGGLPYQAPFVNHLGNIVHSPYIEDHAGCKIDDVELSWEDDQGLIEDLELIDGYDCRYVKFRITAIPDVNANAVISCLDANGDIAWSWHIWACMDDLSTITITNATPKDYSILPLNLGWKWDSSEKLRGKGVYYQFGRKDPFPGPSAYNSSSIIATFGKRAYTTESAVANATTVADSIKRPYSFFYGEESNSYKWCNDNDGYNIWDASRNNSGVDDNIVVKTIYDPCPVGFTVPNSRIFTGFNAGGVNTSDATLFNVVGSFTAGWFFKRNSDDAIGTFFPASGYRYRGSGGLSDVGGYGDYWCAGPSSSAYGRFLGFGSGYVYPLNANGRACGFSVRPARELN